MHKLDELSRCLTTLKGDRTLIAVIEMSQLSWVVAGIVPGVERQPPRLGEHNTEVLAEAGFTTAEIAALAEAGVITAASS